MIILACCFMTFFNRVRVKNPVAKYLLVFLSVNLLSYLLQITYMDMGATMLGNTLIALMPFIAFARLGQRKVLTSNFLVVSAVALTVCAYFYYQFALSSLILMTDSNRVTVNASVVFLMILPLSFLIKNKVLSLSVVCVCIFFLISAVKRGNIIAAIIPLAIYVYELWKSTNKSFFKKAIVIIVVVIIASWVSDLIINNEYFQLRLKQTEHGNSSGRDHIYATMWNMWYNKADFGQFLFGYGYAGTRLYSGIGYLAHNDWLEILVDFGLSGAILYLLIFVSLIRQAMKIKQRLFRNTLFSVILIWLFKTFYSMAFTDEYLCILSFPYGYIVGQHLVNMKKIHNAQT